MTVHVIIARALSTQSQGAIYNSIFWWNRALAFQEPIIGNPTVEYSDVEGIQWIGGPGMKNFDPLFANLANGRLTLKSGSPCLDAADYNRLPKDSLDVNGNGDIFEIMPIDLGGSLRLIDLPIIGGGVGAYIYLDMGAYERQIP